MSLLLKALENAARNRETAGPASDAGATASEPQEPREELTLEPMQQSARGQASARSQNVSRGAAQHAAIEEERIPSPHQTQAQSVLRAGASPSRPGVFEWLARRPLVAFSTAAGLFAIGYGTYLYLQLTNPGIFTARPGPVAKPPAVATNPPPGPTPQPPAPPIASTAPTPAPPSIAPGPAEPAPVLPSPAFTPGAAPPAPPSAAAPPPAAGSPPSATMSMPPAATSTPASATSTPPAAPAPGQTMTARAPPPAPASPPAPKIAVASEQPDAAARPRAARSAPARPATPPLAEGVVPSPAGQVVPVSTTLSSAHVALEKGQLDEAERLYRQTLASDPRSIDAMLGLAAALTPQNKTDAATQYYLRVLEQDPRNTHAQAGLLNLTGRADPVAAEARLKQLIARDPSPFLYFSLGNLYAEHGQWAPAQAAYFQAHSLSPDNPDYAFNLAVGLEHLSQPKIALNYYRRALALAQSRGYAQFDAAGVQSRIRILETALAEKP